MSVERVERARPESCGRATGNPRGISSLELLVALALSILLGTALLGLTIRVADFQASYAALIEREQLLLVVPSLLNRLLTASGNRVDPEQGLNLAGDGAISSRSDLDGRDGFPDGVLEQSFESLRLRAEQGQLQIASGGGSFQSFGEGVTSLQVRRLNSAGIWLDVMAITDVVPGVGHSLQGEESEIYLWLWNYRPSLFPRRDQEDGQ